MTIIHSPEAISFHSERGNLLKVQGLMAGSVGNPRRMADQ